MSLFATLAISVGLAMDAFAVAIASSIAMGDITRRQIFRFAFHFGLFQALMPILGWMAGRTVHAWIRDWDHWIAFGLLSWVGLKAIREALKEETHANEERADPTRGMSLVMLSTAVSIDALAVGLSFAMLDVQIWTPCIIIGIITGGFTVVGMTIGSRLGSRFGKRMEIVGGLVLLGIGAHILLQHLLA